MQFILTELMSGRKQTVTLSAFKAIYRVSKRYGWTTGYYGDVKVFRHPAQNVMFTLKKED